MGHLVTIQNLLRVIGGPLNFEREDLPFRAAFYPFHFRLEPLMKARYVLAEMPVGALTEEQVAELRSRITEVRPGEQVNRVDALFARQPRQSASAARRPPVGRRRVDRRPAGSAGYVPAFARSRASAAARP